MYKVKGLPWSSGIGKDVQDCTTYQEVMEKAKLNFSVEKCALYAEMPFSLYGDNSIDEEAKEFSHSGHVFRPCPYAYCTYRTDKNIPLGVVKEKYEVVQNIDAFQFFDEAIGKDKAIWQYAGQVGYGERIFITAKLPVSFDINGDPVENYLVFSNSHDGSTSLDILFTPVRVFCTNKLNAAFKESESHLRLRHTKSINEKLHIGSDVLRIACEKAEDSKQLYEALSAINVFDDTIIEYVTNLILTEDEIKAIHSYDRLNCYRRIYNRDYGIIESTNISTRKVNQIKSIIHYYFNGVAQQNIIGTAWGAYNAITGYYANVNNFDGAKRMDGLLYGTANNVMSKALRDAYELRNAS